MNYTYDHIGEKSNLVATCGSCFHLLKIEKKKTMFDRIIFIFRDFKNYFHNTFFIISCVYLHFFLVI